MNWVNEHRLLAVSIVLAIGFLVAVINMKQPASQGAQAPFATINADSKMAKGSPDAPVSLVQYSDFICPSCSYFSTQVMPQLEKDYIDTGKVRFEFRPMAFIADGSTQAGMGAYCAIEQDKLWPYHDAIYTDVANKVFNMGLDPKQDIILTADSVKTLASTAGLDATTFNTCLDSNNHQSDIREATNTANKQGVTGTPYIMVNGTPVTGNPTLETVEAMIKAKL